MGKYQKIKEKGQALLIVLLGMAVVMVISLSIISRSITDVSITTKDEDSQRAFSAAEAGVEEALLTGVNTGIKSIGVSTYDAKINDYTPDPQNYFYPGALKSGDSATIWFVDHDENGDLTCDSGYTCLAKWDAQFHICWGEEGAEEGATTSPAIEVTVFYDQESGQAVDVHDFSDVQVARTVYDSTKTSPRGNFKPSAGSCRSDRLTDYNYPFSTGDIFSDIFTSSGDRAICLGNKGCMLFARVKMLYNNNKEQPLGAYIDGADFSSQGKEISSIGDSSEAVTKLQVISTYEAPLAVFENALYTSSSIEK